MWGIPAICSAIIRHVIVPISPLSMDQPAQYISGNSCHKEREQRVLYHPVCHGSLAFTKVPLCLRIPFSGLSGVVLASVVHVSGCSRRLVGNVGQGFPH